MNLSIVVPVYNIEDYVAPLLDSLLNQSDQQFEVIVVDDGSTDHTYNKVESVLSKHPGLYYRILRTENHGVSAARNKGLSEAIGKYVLFLDGDDYASTNLVEQIYEHTRIQEPEIICWGYNLVRENKSTIVSFTSKLNAFTGVEALHHIFVQKSLRVWTGSVAFRREFLLENGLKYTERCVNGEDQEFIYKALSRASQVITLPDVLSYYLQRGSSISNTYNVKKFDVVDAFKRVDEYFKVHPSAELKAISDLLLNREMTENYFFNLSTCITGTQGIRIQDLLHDIDQKYPSLNQEMRGIMKHYTGDDRKLALRIKAFLISPALYHRLIQLDKSYIHLKNRIKTVIKVQENA